MVGRDAVREQVVVVGGQRDHRQDLAVLGVHDDEHPPLEVGRLHPPLERLLGLALDVEVDGQLERGASDGLLERLEHTHDPTGGVALHLLQAVLAPQLALESGLHALLADGVIRQVAVALERLVVVRRDAPGPAHDLGDEWPVQVVSARSDVHGHARQPQVLLRDDAGHAGRDALRDGHRVIGRPGAPIDGAIDVRGRLVQELRQAGHHGVAHREGDLAGQHVDHEDGHVRDQLLAVPVVDETARDGHRLGAPLLLDGKVLEVLGVRDSELEQPQAECRDAQDDRDAEDHETPPQTARWRRVRHPGVDHGRSSMPLTSRSVRSCRSGA